MLKRCLFMMKLWSKYTNCYHQQMWHGHVCSYICASVYRYRQCSGRLGHLWQVLEFVFRSWVR